MTTTEKYTSNPKVVAIDETQHWSDELKAKCGKIETVYLFDASVQTHCCSILPSYYLIPLYYVIENEVSDEIHEQVQNELSNDNPNYYDCGYIDSMESVAVSKDFEFESADSEEYKEYFEEVEEYCKCNHQI